MTKKEEEEKKKTSNFILFFNQTRSAAYQEPIAHDVKAKLTL